MTIKKMILPGLIILCLVIYGVWFVHPKNPPTTSSITVKTDSKKIEDRVFAYLEKNVPEINAFRQEIEKAGDGQLKLVIRMDGVPDKKSNDPYHDYYCIYVGEDHPDHTVRWNTFYVNSALTQILVADNLTGEVVTLGQWRKTKI